MSLRHATKAGALQRLVTDRLDEVKRVYATGAPSGAREVVRLSVKAKSDYARLKATEMMLTFLQPKAPSGPLVAINQLVQGTIAKLDIPTEAEGDEVEALNLTRPALPAIRPAALPRTLRAASTDAVPGEIGAVAALPLTAAAEEVLPAEEPRRPADSNQPHKKVTW